MNLDFSVVANSLPYLWKGFQYTLQLTVTSAIGGLFFGLASGGDVGGDHHLRQPTIDPS